MLNSKREDLNTGSFEKSRVTLTILVLALLLLVILLDYQLEPFTFELTNPVALLSVLIGLVSSLFEKPPNI